MDANLESRSSPTYQVISLNIQALSSPSKASQSEDLNQCGIDSVRISNSLPFVTSAIQTL